MEHTTASTFGLLLAGSVLCLSLEGPGKPRLVAAPAPAAETQDFSYETYCEAAQGGALTGYVRNKGAETFQVDGFVRFNFSSETGIARSAIEVRSGVFVSPNQTALVASVPLTFALEKGERCRFEVGDALRGVKR